MKKPTIICVDDEKIVLDSLKNELKEYFETKLNIETAESGEEALEIIDEIIGEGGEIPIIVADYLMPQMKGDELLIKTHELLPKTLNILLTGQATLEGVANAINDAKLYRYIAKPWEKNDLMLTLKEAYNSYNKDKQIKDRVNKLKEMSQLMGEKVSETENKIMEAAVKSQDEIKSSIKDVVNVLFEKMADINPPVYKKTIRLRDQMIKVAQEMNYDEIWEVETLALLSHLSCMNYTKETAEWFFIGEKSGTGDLQKIQDHNKETYELLKNTQSFENLAKTILYMYDDAEHIEKISSQNIMKLYNILKVVDNYDILISSKKTSNEALSIMRENMAKYDKETFDVFEKVIS